jgi:hypothetical protein
MGRMAVYSAASISRISGITAFTAQAYLLSYTALSVGMPGKLPVLISHYGFRTRQNRAIPTAIRSRSRAMVSASSSAQPIS